MNWKMWVPLILAGVLAVVAAKVGRNMMVADNKQAPTGKQTKIVIAAGELPPGHALTELDLKEVNVPNDAVPRGSFTSRHDLVDRVTSFQVVAGQSILETLLCPKGSASGASALIPQGMRAVSIDVTESTAVAGLLVPGCRVDILATIREEKANLQLTRTIVENVRVLAVGQKVSQPTPLKAGEAEQAMQLTRTVTVVVSPRDAEAIELASQAGRTRLALRGTFDVKTGLASGVTMSELLGTGTEETPHSNAVPTTNPSVPALPSRAVATKWVIEVLRAGQYSQTQVERPQIQTAETKEQNEPKEPMTDQTQEQKEVVPPIPGEPRE